MDNLKFTAEMTIIETEGVSKSKGQKCLVVQTCTRNNIYYKSIVNVETVQYPEIFLTPKMATESIIKHISSEPTYTYDEKTDVIEIKYKVINTYGICILLKKDLTQIPTVEQRITRIELLLETLVLDELIESHLYPSYDTYDQFTQLPSYKYFDAFHNAQRYFNKEPVMHLGKFREFYYGLHVSNLCGQSMSFSGSQNTDNEKTQYMTELAEFVKPVTMLQNKEYELTTADVNFYSTMYKQFDVNFASTIHRPTHPNGNKYSDSYRDYFQSSLKTFIHRVNTNQLCNIINEYIRMYIFGFYLINHQLLIGRTIRIEVHISDNMYIHIFRSKKIQLYHYDVKIPTALTICNINTVKVDGVYIFG